MEYKPLNMFIKQTEELQKLIAAHPDYPIVVLCSSDVVADDGYSYWYAPKLSFTIGEILDCEQDVNDEKTYSDRDDFEDDVRYMFECDGQYDNLSSEEFDELVKNELEKYEPYWKDVIIIYADI